LNGTGGLHSIAADCLGGSPVGAAIGYGSFWVRVSSGYHLYRLDAATAQVTADISGLPQAPSGFTQVVAAGEGAIWTSNIAAGTVSRIDPATNRVVATIPV
jgi:YVTN family beta-propeller protein